MANFILEFLQSNQSEFWNLLFAANLIFIITWLIFETLKQKGKHFAFIIFACLVSNFVLAMRATYYINVMVGFWSRPTHGTFWVGNPTPFLWGGLSIIIVGFIFQIRYSNKIEFLLDKASKSGGKNGLRDNDNDAVVD